MRQTSKKFIRVNFTLTEEDLKILNELYEFGNFASKSEVIRHCIRNNGIAEYKLKSKKEESRKERIANMTNEEYLHNEFAGFDYEIVDSPEGKKVLFKRGLHEGKILLSKIKNLTRDHPDVDNFRPED